MGGIIGALIGIIVVLILLGLAWWAINELLPLITQYLPAPFAKIIHVLMVVILVLIVLWAILALLGAAGVKIPFSIGKVGLPGPATFGATAGYLHGLLS